MSEKQEKPNILGPTHFTGLKLTEPKAYAAGMPAVKVALEHALKEMGLKRSFATLSSLNQQEGIDCPGCAWPDPKKRSKLGEFCENGVKAIAEEATTARVDVDFFQQHSVVEMSNWTDYEIGKSGRITHPLILKPGASHYEPISWEEAFQTIAQQLKALENPDQAVFYTSGRSSNEAAFLYGLFIRAFGTNNMPDCSNMCHESSGVALSETLGIGKGSVTLEDFQDAEVVMVIGQNPGTNHPRMLSALQKCKERGGKVIAVNPLKEAGLLRFKDPQEVKGVVGSGTAITDLYLQVRINQDVALLKLIMKKLLERDTPEQPTIDHEFIKAHTAGYDAFVNDLKQYDNHELLRACGIPEADIDQAVDLLSSRRRIIICWAMGLTQHKNGVDNIKECVNLLLLKGSLGKKGAGTCPVRGHSNVQGDRTVGIVHHAIPSLNRAFKRVFDFEPPEKDGLDVVHSIKAMHEGKARVFIALGGNFLSAASDTRYTGEALQNCDLTVSISTKLNRTHLIPGKTALILPTLGRTEQDHKGNDQRYVTVENSMGRVHRSQGKLAPASSHLLSEPEIVSRMAEVYFGKSHHIPWAQLGQDYDLVREKISQVFDGFDKYTERSQKSGFDLPNHVRAGNFEKMPGGKAHFSVCKMGVSGLKKEEFLLTTIRSHDQFNTTIYGLDDRYRGVYNERRVVFMNAEDMSAKNLKTRDAVVLQSHYGGKVRTAENFLAIPYDLPQGNAAAYFPETNVLIPNDQFADKSFTPISKSVVVTITKA